MQITTKFSVGQRAYFPIFATATIYAVTIKMVYLRNGYVFYDLVRADNGYEIEGVPEADVLVFPEAKAKLVAYLEGKLNEINNLVAP